jgi:hypothetical protein
MEPMIVLMFLSNEEVELGDSGGAMNACDTGRTSARDLHRRIVHLIRHLCNCLKNSSFADLYPHNFY